MLTYIRPPRASGGISATSDLASDHLAATAVPPSGGYPGAAGAVGATSGSRRGQGRSLARPVIAPCYYKCSTAPAFVVAVKLSKPDRFMKRRERLRKNELTLIMVLQPSPTARTCGDSFAYVYASGGDPGAEQTD
jgi:hypothetical protein